MRKLAATLVTAMVAGMVVLGAGRPALAHPGHSISVDNVTVSEGATTATFTLAVTPPPEAGETVSVDVGTANGSALGAASCPAFPPGSASSDYARVPTTKVTFSAGESTKQRPVTVCPDAAPEGDETFFLNLSDAAFTCTAPCGTSSASIGDFQGVGTITDDEAAPALQIGDRTSAEGALSTSNFGFEVTLSAATNKTVTVQYATSNGTAAAPTDYQSRTGTLTFPANSTAAQTINVPVVGDMAAETDETFFVELSSPTNAKVGDPQGVGTIQNDDASTTGANALTITDVTRNEGNNGSAPTTPFTFTVTLGAAPGPGRTASVNYHVTEGTATAGSDYIFDSGTRVFDGSETAKTISVPVFGDTTSEAAETFNVILSGAACTTSTTPCDAPSITDNTGRGTINNDDTTPPGPGPTPINATLKIGGYFQVRVTAGEPCPAGRLVKVKRSAPGTDKVIVSGNTGSDGVFKQAVRPKKRGKFYAQAYNTRREGSSGPVLCKGGKSPIRTLPA